MLPILDDASDFHRTIFGVAGVLLGLAFSALLFILSGAFKEFPASRRMFLKFYATLGANLLSSLALVTGLCFVSLYFPKLGWLLSLVCYGGVLIWAKTLLDYKAHRGYMHTLFSTAFVPRRYGAVRQYFRYIRNLGVVQNGVVLLEVGLLAVYPLVANHFVTGDLFIGGSCVVFLIAGHFAYALLRILAFVPQFFHITETEHLKTDGLADPNGDQSESKANIDYGREKEALKTHLLNHGFSELNGGTVPFLNGSVSLNFGPNKEGREAWFNVWVEIGHHPPGEIRTACLDYAQRLLQVFCRSGCDIDEIVVSFHMTIDEEPHPDAIFLRSDRTELEGLLPPRAVDSTSLLKIKSKLIRGVYKQ